MIFVKEGEKRLSTTLELQKDIDFCNSYMDNNVIQGNVKGEDFKYQSFEVIATCVRWCIEDLEKSTSLKEQAILRLTIEKMSEDYVRRYNINADKYNVPHIKLENFAVKKDENLDKKF